MSGETTLDENQRANVREAFDEDGLEEAIAEARFYRPGDADLEEWLTETFRDLGIVDEDEEIVAIGPFDSLYARELAREEECPVCGETADHVVDDVERLSTPSRIEESWDVCVDGGSLYVHNIGSGTYIGREKRS